jgi:Caspase domain
MEERTTPLVVRDVTGPSAASPLDPAHDFALVVGVDHYPRFRSLQGALADATAFHGWVCDAAGGGVELARGRLITSTPSPATPIQDQIDEQLLELMTAADELGGGRRLYFFFSGHGAMSPDESGDDVALLLATWSKNLQRFALSSRSYSSELGGTGLFQELVIFLDCCRTAAVRAVGRPPAITYEMTRARYPTRTFVAYAAEAGRPAFERRDGEQHDLWQGVFTRCLLSILRRSPGGIEARALKDQLEREVREARAGQQAHVVNGLRDGARFGLRGIVPRMRVTFGTVRGRVKLLDGGGQLVAEHEATAEPWLISAAAGLYKLVAESGARLLVDHGLAEMTDVAF